MSLAQLRRERASPPHAPLAAEGNTAEALRVYEQLRVLLRDELGVGPSAPTQAAYGALLG